jgi:hypothetical protein
MQDASKRPGTNKLLALKSVREHAAHLDIELPPLPPSKINTQLFVAQVTVLNAQCRNVVQGGVVSLHACVQYCALYDAAQP